MNTIRHYSAFILIIVVTITIMITFLIPLFGSLAIGGNHVGLLLSDTMGIKQALFRTCIFALLSSVMNTVIGLQFSLFLRSIPINSKVGVALSLLLMPIVLGNVTTSYVFKCTLYGSSLFDSIIGNGAIVQTLLMLLLQFWQYGFLFTYLFWICIRQIPEKKYTYAYSVMMTEREIVKNIIFPSVKNLFLLLYLINFIFTFYESAKYQFVLKSSQGLGTELISQALYRVYQSLSIANPELSQSIIFSNGVYVMLCAILIMACSCLAIWGMFSVTRKRYGFPLCTTNKGGRIIAVLCITAVLLPIVIALFKSKYNFSVESIAQMGVPLCMTFVSALFASFLAVMFGISIRMLFKRTTRWSISSFAILLMVFLIQLVPPVCVMICGYKWMSIVGYNEVIMYAVWIWGHPILVFPVLGSFIISTHFIVSNNEIDWNFIHMMKCQDIIKYSFLKRFYKDYILTFLFAFTFIWNDVTLNKILSDEIPSFSEKMQRLFIGRAANDAQATLYALVAIIIASSCIAIWQNVLKRFNIEK